jgi:uncharacterized protein
MTSPDLSRVYDVRSIAILLWGTDPDQPALCATPFMHAAAAAAMDFQVEVYFSARSALLLVPGAAERLRAGGNGDPSIAEFMRQSHQHGAKFFACSAAMKNLQLAREQLGDWVDGVAGASTVVARLADPAWRVMVF